MLSGKTLGSMPQTFLLTHLLDQLFGGLLAAGFHAVGLPVDKASAQAASVISSFTIEVLVAAALIVFFLAVRATLSVENPGPVHALLSPK